MRYLIILIFLLTALPGFCKLNSQRCNDLIQAAQNTRNLNLQTRLIGDAYLECYSGETGYQDSINFALNLSNQAIQFDQQAQINNLQNQQNYTNSLLLQQNLNQR